MYKLSIAAVAILLFSVTEPVIAFNSNGEVLRGTATVNSNGGWFNVSSNTRSCYGSYVGAFTPTVSMPVVCSDGGRGVVFATRSPNPPSSVGYAQMSNGDHATFMVGSAAPRF
jgi:hypothetical protein